MSPILRTARMHVGTHGSCVRSVSQLTVDEYTGEQGDCSALNGRTSRASLHAYHGWIDA